MKPLVTALFGVVFASAVLSGYGCALTNYELITDTDGNPINTLGSAYVKQETQFATEFPDGTDNLLWYVDQRRNGDRKLYTVNYFTPPGGGNPFKDEQYCQPDPVRCRIVTADDPETCDVDEFDYREHPGCSGYRSLMFLTSATRELGECGRAEAIGQAVKMIGLAAGMTPLKIDGETWLRKTLSAKNTAIVLDNRAGDVYRLPLTATAGVRANFTNRQVLLDLTDPKMRDLFQDALAWSRLHTGRDGFVATVTIDGVDLSYRLKFARDAAAAIDRRYR